MAKSVQKKSGKKITPATVTLSTSQTSYTIPKGLHSGSGVVKIQLEEKSVTPTSVTQIITPSSGKVLSKVNVSGVVLQHYYTTTTGYGAHSFTIPNTSGKSGMIVVMVAETNQGNNPYDTMSVSRQSGKQVITSRGNISGKDAIFAGLLTFRSGSGNITLSFSSGTQGGTIQVLCTYVTY